ncbi:Pkinase-domain-containing protein [Wallemia mellicola]|uniref:Pkinase-domain-containing protein n=1 Tax=Wallemia mellicola TaxID=1708541 RepID=A0A4T0PXR2_9BASI|nr:Pkinase-domain-containing protein [Wallemia mellicola]TIB98730.1 Pkinase-domain-containing protein [Wallemia mellicola]TIC16105.1 Pkinase-domain-containing protein [Wallemia mellicola]TIC34216.1 Pkinase-domain-containing protein [Wallemia mellicola]
MDESFHRRVQNWRDDDISNFLNEHNCAIYVPLFRDNDIRGDNILDVDQIALKEMGIPKVGDRVKINVAINGLRNRCFDELVQLDQKKSRSLALSRSEGDNRQRVATSKSSQTRPPPLVLDQLQPPQQHKNDIPYQPQNKSAKSTLAALGVPGLKRPRGNSNPSNRDLYTSSPLPQPSNSSRKNLLNISSGSIKRPSTSNVVSRKQLALNGTRPNTANPALHPYAKSQVSPTESIREEMFENGYRIGAGPYQSHNNSKLSLTDVRRKCVKFITAEDGFTRVVDVSECENASDVLARVLKKFGKINYQAKSQSGAIEDNDRSYFVYQGWGVFRCVDGQIYGYPLSESEIIAVCQSPPNDSQRERGLYIQRTEDWQLPKPKSKKKFEAFFTDMTPQKKMSKQALQKQSAESLRMKKKTNRASMMSVMSGLGAVPEHDEKPLYESAAQLPSVNQADRVANPRGRLQNFHGQRPPSELISTHLADFFPTADIKSINKTARNSRIHRRDGSSVSTSSRPIWESEPMPELPIPPSKFFDEKYKIPQKEPPKDDIPPVPAEQPPMLPPVNVEPLDWSETKSMGSLKPSSIASKKSKGGPNDDTSSILTMDQVVQEVENRVSNDDYRDVVEIGSIHSEEGSIHDESELKRKEEQTGRVSPAYSQLSPKQQPLDLRASPVSQHSQRSDVSPSSPTSQASPGSKSKALSTHSNEANESRSPSPLEPPPEINIGDNFLRRPSVGLGPEAEENQVDYVPTDDEDDKYSYNERKPIKWHKGALIGSGSFGSVYLGMNKSTGLLMAVKQVDLPAGNSTGVHIEPRKKSMLDALEREIELLKVLKHKNIVQYLDSSLDEACLNIFLEYVPGGSVAALLQNYGAFEEELVRNFVKQILTGLNYLHTKGIIHRDIKGANILVDNKGGVKISDFGISKKKVTDNLFGANKVVRQSLQGSVFWMAPEVVKQEPYTRKADIWSLGCLIVEMLTGEHPFPSLNQMQAIFKIGSSASPTIPDDISDDAKDFLKQTFETDSAARPSAAVLERSAFITQITATEAGNKDALKEAVASTADVSTPTHTQDLEVL